MSEWIGPLGHFSVILSFVGALLAAWFYSQSAIAEQRLKSGPIGSASLAFWLHSLGVIGTIVCLFTIIHQHFYNYHYAWAHSSNNLPVHYMISCFWEGQEGSFLLWIFWNMVLGLILMVTSKGQMRAPMLAVFAAVQAFLCSMILGISLGDLKIGSSPFILLRDAMPDLPVWKIKPDFVPEDGRGLNPLLQNYWMVIHPPTLFLGFATTLIPFSYAIASLVTKQYKQWVRPALPWTLFSASIMGIGILMGAYWAYETLNFGGYWNWDPVENAVYIPWLVLIATIHGMIVYQRQKTSLKVTYLLAVATFILVLYATFLTRSGILGNASVHSFTDLGLSGQLLVYLISFLLLAGLLLFLRWRFIEEKQSENSLYTQEFWILSGSLLLSLAAFQVLFSTSIPVYNTIFKAFGLEANMAPPADAIGHYTQWQQWFFITISVVSVVAQYIWWGRVKGNNDWGKLWMPLAAAFSAGILVAILGHISDPVYLVVLTASLFGMLGNAFMFWHLAKRNMKLAGGTLAHIGVALMLIGILYSSGYSNVLSINRSGLIYRKEFSTEMNRDNVLLWRSTPNRMGEFVISYLGNAQEIAGFPTYVKKEFLEPTADPYKVIARAQLDHDGKNYFKRGDTLRTQPENTYYAIEFIDTLQKDTFVLFPRAQVNPNMGLLASPDIKKFATRDLYMHVSSIPDPKDEKEWSETENHSVAVGDTFFVNDMVTQLVNVARISAVPDMILEPGDVAVKATIRVMGKGQNHIAEPIFVVKGQEIGRIPQTIDALGMRFALLDIDPIAQKFVIGSNTTDREWVILKVMEKPQINILWGGALIMSMGFVMAIFRRRNEALAKA